MIFTLAGSDEVVNDAQFLLASFKYVPTIASVILEVIRTLWIISIDQSLGFPAWINQFFAILSLFASDFLFVQPGCVGVSSYEAIFGINLGSMLSKLKLRTKFDSYVWFNYHQQSCTYCDL